MRTHTTKAAQGQGATGVGVSEALAPETLHFLHLIALITLRLWSCRTRFVSILLQKVLFTFVAVLKSSAVAGTILMESPALSALLMVFFSSEKITDSWAHDLLTLRMTGVEFRAAWRPHRAAEPPGAATEAVAGWLAGRFPKYASVARSRRGGCYNEQRPLDAPGADIGHATNEERPSGGLGVAAADLGESPSMLL